MMRIEVMPPSRLGAAELTAWAAMQAATPHLQRGFFTPGFARACEAAGYAAKIGVLHENGAICGFMPFQFGTIWHARMGIAERIGGMFNDQGGLVAAPGVLVTPAELLRGCGIGCLFSDHLADGQEAFGLIATEARIGHRIDIDAGSAAYFAALTAERKPFVQDTERRLRRAEREFGPLQFTFDAAPGVEAVRTVIDEKRAHYRRTGAGDCFDDPRRITLVDALVEARDPQCRVVLTMLTAGDRVLARHFGLLHAGVLSYWFPVYDPAAQKVSPGRLLLWHTLRTAEENGLRLIDRGEGDNEAKRDFSTGTARFGRVNWSAGTSRAMAARLWQAAEWRLAARREREGQKAE